MMAFKMFDKDGSGALSHDEIKEVICFDSFIEDVNLFYFFYSEPIQEMTTLNMH